jgi:hypothetical protein
MNRFIQKIAVILFACLMVLNLAAGDTVVAAPCPTHLCCDGPMDMGHHNGMINFAFPMQGCCEDCNDPFCDLLKDPLQDVNAANYSPFQGHYNPVILGSADSIGQSGLRDSVSVTRHPLIDFRASSQIPLYLENLSLII